MLHIALKMAQDINHDQSITYIYCLLADMTFQQVSFRSFFYTIVFAFFLIISLVYFRMIIFKRRIYLNPLLVDCYLMEVIVNGLYFEICTNFFLFAQKLF